VVSTGLVLAIAAGLVLLVGGLGTVGTLTAFLKTKLTPQEVQAEKEKAASRDAKGAIGNSVDFLFGEGVTQQSRDAQKLTNIRATESDIRKQALAAGFDSLEEFEMETDSCALVVGGIRKFCDIGQIGKTDESIAPKGGQSNIGTRSTSTFGTRNIGTETPVISKVIDTNPIFRTTSATRGQTRFNR